MGMYKPICATESRLFDGFHGGIFTLYMWFVAQTKPGIQFATLPPTGMAGGTGNGEYLFGGEFALFHRIRILNHTPMDCSVLDKCRQLYNLSED